MRRVLVPLLLLLAGAGPGRLEAADGVVVIGHPALRPINVLTLEKIYTGKLIQLGEVFVTPVNAEPGSRLRERFLQAYLKQDEGRYTGYWRVRRSIGQGKPPRELASAEDVIQFVNTTPGAIGYIDEKDLRPGVLVLLR
ncbi:MAG: hypothetical protein U1F00_05440 [Rhodoferax sp.]|jgi:ABC-type phosphate transport system substrate-binding protein